MTYFSNKENQTSTELLLVSAEKLLVSSPASVTTASSSNTRPVTCFSQFAVQNNVTKSEILWALHMLQVSFLSLLFRIKTVVSGHVSRQSDSKKVDYWKNQIGIQHYSWNFTLFSQSSGTFGIKGERNVLLFVLMNP